MEGTISADKCRDIAYCLDARRDALEAGCRHFRDGFESAEIPRLPRQEVLVQSAVADDALLDDEGHCDFLDGGKRPVGSCMYFQQLVVEVERDFLASSASVVEAEGECAERLVDGPGRLALRTEVLDHHRGEGVAIDLIPPEGEFGGVNE